MIEHGGTEARRDSNLSQAVIGACIEVHRHLGPGLLESVYEVALSHELTLRGIAHHRQFVVPVSYEGVELECGYRIDVIVENQLILELKAVEQVLPVHEAQILTYMKLTGIGVGLLVNFKVGALRRGVKRFVST